jgi:hypothetical protein
MKALPALQAAISQANWGHRQGTPSPDSFIVFRARFQTLRTNNKQLRVSPGKMTRQVSASERSGQRWNVAKGDTVSSTTLYRFQALRAHRQPLKIYKVCIVVDRKTEYSFSKLPFPVQAFQVFFNLGFPSHTGPSLGNCRGFPSFPKRFHRTFPAEA